MGEDKLRSQPTFDLESVSISACGTTTTTTHYLHCPRTVHVPLIGAINFWVRLIRLCVWRASTNRA